MNNFKCLIICGGPGKRLRPITYYFQKAMIPVGLRQKPMLEYVVRLLRFHGIADLYFLVDYKAEQVMNYFNDGSKFDVSISYLHDDPMFKGTAGSVLNAYDKGLLTIEDRFVVYYGDILTTINLKDLLNYHEKKKTVATVALSSGFTVRVGIAEMDNNGEIRGFVEKPRLEKPVSIGIIAFEGEVLKDMKELKGPKRGLDLMKDFIPHLVKNSGPVYGYLSDAFWYDVGSIEAYEKLNHKQVENLMSYLFE
ncbi:MAG: nucleotidyltransferase family protein [Candidatus Bathyarchaeota archaeon]|jgi:mannose-1-phosphate guanylyltransferase